MIERSHLKIIQALAEHGTLTAAANALFVTQPALSHQMRYLEQKLEVSLWERQGRKLRLTQAGELLLRVAGQLLPVLEQTENTLKAYAEGKQGILRLGVECHPCYEWLKGVLADYLVLMPKMDVDIVHKFQFSGLQGLLNYHIDLLVTPDKVNHQGVVYAPLFDYELVLLVARQNPMATNQFVEADALAGELLLTFPVPHERLDIYTQFLMPAGISPRNKAMASLDIMIQMAALNRGVTILPDWLARQYTETLPVTTLRLGKKGVMKTLFAAMREGEETIPYMNSFIELGQQKAIS
ncbi:LysR family transcriptional regulator [Methylophaga sp.]|jgi:LysR family transcriptional regulator for metE and metH|uniref:LysR family transcriptional regulator n=1 Tax=Methylophaga sp. TaxID=2024840 RepID=UPI0014019CFF|nr:LysR family transcriptional regulator [Methylophaga sp.]MTI63024.1 LysR family transcriptional regulator [Methylophaga sp.]